MPVMTLGVGGKIKYKVGLFTYSARILVCGPLYLARTLKLLKRCQRNSPLSFSCENDGIFCDGAHYFEFASLNGGLECRFRYTARFEGTMAKILTRKHTKLRTKVERNFNEFNRQLKAGAESLWRREVASSRSSLLLPDESQKNKSSEVRAEF